MGDFEDFQPATFRSSREKRAEIKKQNISDYADDEDNLGGTEETVKIPTVSTAVCKAAQNGFKPFGKDSEKQSRYLAFLKYQLGELTREELLDKFTGDQRETTKDFEEFLQVVAMFKPTVTSQWASKFTPASSSTGTTQTDQKAKVETIKKDDAPIVARRTINNWEPSRILCQRFNVPYLFGPVEDVPTYIEPAARAAQKAKSASYIFKSVKSTKQQQNSQKPNVPSMPFINKPSTSSSSGYDLV